jgi:hypothetical protein
MSHVLKVVWKKGRVPPAEGSLEERQGPTMLVENELLKVVCREVPPAVGVVKEREGHTMLVESERMFHSKTKRDIRMHTQFRIFKLLKIEENIFL